MRVHFRIPNDSASSRVRGRQMAAALGGTVGLRQTVEADVIIFVKEFPSPRLVEDARKKSRLVIYDPVDNFDFDRMRGEFGVVFAANRNHAGKLGEIFHGSPIEVVPHHHCIHEGTFRPSYSDTVGYVGEPCNLGLEASVLRAAFPDFLDSRALRALHKIGIGIAYRPPGDGRNYKSNIKVANYWAHGIATVCSHEASYTEMQEGQERSLLFVDGEKETIEAIRFLKEKEEQRRALAESGLRNAVRYSIRNISMLYSSIIKAHL